MNYRFLGSTGLRVSELCLGTMTFGRENEATEEESGAMMDRFAGVGGNFIDTANVYSLGVSEEIVGRWLKGKNREDWVVATKVRFPMGEGPNDAGLSRKHVLASFEASLRRLQTDYIDLFQVHCWDPMTPLEETLSTLDQLVKKGAVRYLGASNYAGWQLQRAIDLSRELGWERFVCLQPQYNLLCRSTEWELIPVALREGLGVTWRVIDVLQAVAKEVGKTPAQVAINWLLRKPGVTAPIIGAKRMEQLETNLAAAGWQLDSDHLNQLDEASQPTLPYPYDFIQEAAR
jgi:aryl-alcohol dehydrogenase-like predicted oxidoreductase